MLSVDTPGATQATRRDRQACVDDGPAAGCAGQGHSDTVPPQGAPVTNLGPLGPRWSPAWSHPTAMRRGSGARRQRDVEDCQPRGGERGAQRCARPCDPRGVSPTHGPANVARARMAATESVDVAALAQLARLSLEAHDAETVARQLGEILAHLETLQAIDIDGVLPWSPDAPASAPLRSDVAEAPLDRAAILAGAPAVDGELVAVPRFVDT